MVADTVSWVCTAYMAVLVLSKGSQVMLECRISALMGVVVVALEMVELGWWTGPYSRESVRILVSRLYLMSPCPVLVMRAIGVELGRQKD